KNVITRAVGSRDYVQVDTHCFETHVGDRFLLCSDGLHGYLEVHEIPAIVEMGPDRSVRRFIELANERGGRDNITAIVAEAY
ncbi:MAG: serine/threonine-protein phosphatase, partial [Myxococcales bacterium]|nr:serine/threonine-protein phosphatase [Myxococcales bacterium]